MSKPRKITVNDIDYVWNLNDDMELCIWKANDKGSALLYIDWTMQDTQNKPVTPAIVREYIEEYQKEHPQTS
ncbi:MAG: hypothetical protein LBR25_00095 [Erysipelotrichaceae bacterium]|nr:hypothetical protein [Erysipelotrichaceae bacterium]